MFLFARSAAGVVKVTASDAQHYSSRFYLWRVCARQTQFIHVSICLAFELFLRNK